ncbi:hypothetical protein [Pseudomonas sp. L-22-4S-12]|uniref:hypothetical protein n=1 Tax=Pseudomonas sp. L-22-4S-12 TaxID=2610893 RepID=UPI00211505A1|nr:hypothetical protein [Pseudomonas sp. L-22-4S-12]
MPRNGSKSPRSTCMPENQYERLPHAGDFEREAGTEVFYLAPRPVPTGMPAFSGQNLRQEANEVFLDVGAGQASVEFAARAYIGSVMTLIILFFCASGFGAWLRRYKEPFLDGWIDGFSTPPMWGFIACIAALAGFNMYRIIRNIGSRSPVRFNRQRREVALVFRGEAPVYVPWEEVIACVSASQIVTQYAVMPSFALLLGLRNASSGDVYWVTIPGGNLGLVVSEWEAIRVYMEDGPAALPTPVLSDEEFQEGTVAYFHMCRGVYRQEHWWPRYAFGFLVIQFCSGWTLPCHIAQWVNRRPKAVFPQEVLDWSQPLPTEQHAKPSEALLKESAEIRNAFAKGQNLLDYYKIKFTEEPAEIPVATG